MAPSTGNSLIVLCLGILLGAELMSVANQRISRFGPRTSRLSRYIAHDAADTIGRRGWCSTAMLFAPPRDLCAVAAYGSLDWGSNRNHRKPDDEGVAYYLRFRTRALSNMDLLQTAILTAPLSRDHSFVSRSLGSRQALDETAEVQHDIGLCTRSIPGALGAYRVIRMARISFTRSQLIVHSAEREKVSVE